MPCSTFIVSLTLTIACTCRAREVHEAKTMTEIGIDAAPHHTGKLTTRGEGVPHPDTIATETTGTMAFPVMPREGVMIIARRGQGTTMKVRGATTTDAPKRTSTRTGEGVVHLFQIREDTGRRHTLQMRCLGGRRGHRRASIHALRRLARSTLGEGDRLARIRGHPRPPALPDESEIDHRAMLHSLHRRHVAR